MPANRQAIFKGLKDKLEETGLFSHVKFRRKGDLDFEGNFIAVEYIKNSSVSQNDFESGRRILKEKLGSLIENNYANLISINCEDSNEQGIYKVVFKREISEGGGTDLTDEVLLNVYGILNDKYLFER
jgi:hypothetical protein